MRGRWTDYLRLGRVDYRWSRQQLQQLELAELKIERNHIVFCAIAVLVFSLFMFVQGYWFYVSLRYFREVLIFMVVLYAWHFWRTRRLIRVIDQVLREANANSRVS